MEQLNDMEIEENKQSSCNSSVKKQITDKEIADNLNNQSEGVSEENEIEFKSRFPLNKIKNIMKMNDEVKLVSKHIGHYLGKAVELMLEDLAQKSLLITKSNKRRILNPEDIYSAAKRIDEYEFIDFPSIFPMNIEDLEKKEEKISNKLNNIEKPKKTIEYEEIKITKDYNKDSIPVKKSNTTKIKTSNEKDKTKNNNNIMNYFK